MAACWAVSRLVGYLLGSLSSGRPLRLSPPMTPVSLLQGQPAAASRASSARPQPPQEMGSGVRERFKDEIALIEGAVIGAVIRTLGDMVKQALLPAASPIKSATTKQEQSVQRAPRADSGRKVQYRGKQRHRLIAHD